MLIIDERTGYLNLLLWLREKPSFTNEEKLNLEFNEAPNLLCKMNNVCTTTEKTS